MKKNIKIYIFFDTENLLDIQNFAIFDNFYSTDRKAQKLFLKGLIVGFGIELVFGH